MRGIEALVYFMVQMFGLKRTLHVLMQLLAQVQNSPIVDPPGRLPGTKDISTRTLLPVASILLAGYQMQYPRDRLSQIMYLAGAYELAAQMYANIMFGPEYKWDQYYLGHHGRKRYFPR